MWFLDRLKILQLTGLFDTNASLELILLPPPADTPPWADTPSRQTPHPLDRQHPAPPGQTPLRHPPGQTPHSVDTHTPRQTTPPPPPPLPMATKRAVRILLECIVVEKIIQ